MTVRVVGVRHHSPACARLVAHLIASERPAAVLIEGPSDFNARMGELLLEHRTPVALYSYSNEGERPAQCWFPFVDYSPEWVALRHGHAQGSIVRFIDLPHWRYRALPDARRRLAGTEPLPDSRYEQVVRGLCERFGCDGDNALWDHLFESLPADAHAELQQRLDLYFDELRGDDPGTEQDAAREDCMAHWVAWAQRQAGDRLVLVVCGGWHKRAIESRWPALSVTNEPVSEAPQDERAAGSYLVPFEYRQVDALGGYGSGMQSPMYYQWVWEHGTAEAARRGVQHIVERLRRRKVALSTADLLAYEHALEGLRRLRGHEVALRTDVLDALQSAVIKEALDAPAPWTAQGLLGAQHHPVLREALMALTGDEAGRLHGDTPLPPLLHDVTHRLAQCELQLTRTPQPLVLDRRREPDSRRAELLWQLSLLGVESVRLTATRAPNGSRGLPDALRFEEHWSIAQDDRWHPQLIEAAMYGATLESAARHCLLERVQAAGGAPEQITQCLLQAVRCGLVDMGEALGRQLLQTVPQMHDVVALGQAAHQLLDVAQAGFWGVDTRPLMEEAVAAMADRLLWLLETHAGGQPGQIAGEVDAVRVFDTLLRLQIEGIDARFCLETLLRFARTDGRAPALRGASLAVAHVHGALGDDATQQILAVVRAMPARDALGDFLYGLFSCARALATQSDEIVQAVHGALEAMTTDDFLVALPQLRNAFSWFPPRERGALSVWVANLMGLSIAGRQQLLTLRGGAEALVDARRVEAQALQWAREMEWPL